MRVLLTTWGWRSHFYCLVPLGWALRAAGHEVRVASQPALADAITSAGLPAVPMGEDLDFVRTFAGRIDRVPAHAAGDAGAGGSEGGSGADEAAVTPDGGVVRFAEAIIDDLVAFGRHFRPDLVVYEPFNLAGPVAAAALGVPGVLQLWGPDSSVTLRLDPQRIFGPLAARFGLTVADVCPPGALVLDPAPAALQVPLPGPRQPVRFVPYNGVATLPDWLWRPPPRRRVCVTTGTMMTGLGLSGAFELGRVVRAVAELDVEVVVAVDAADQAGLGEPPPHVRLVRSPLALHLLLSTCDALVQQGGAGTTMTALACGVPQLVLPQVSDQHFNAERLASTGAGTWLERATAEAIRDRVADLLGGERWRAAAAGLRDQINAAPSPADVVTVLDRLAGDPPPPAAATARHIPGFGCH